MTIRDPRVVSTDAVHVEFELSDPSQPFIGLSAIEDCEVKLEEILPRGRGGYRGYYSVRDSDPAQLLAQAAMYKGLDARFLDQDEDSGLLELSISEPCPAMFLAERGGLPRRVSATSGVGRITAELLPESDEQETIDDFVSTHPTAELLAHRQQSYHTPMFSHRELDRAVEDLLTDRQQEVLRGAYEAGYYEWPREANGEDVAAQLDISPPTFTEHLRAAERKVITLLFDGDGAVP